MGAVMTQLQASLDRVEQRQAATLDLVEEQYVARAKRIRGVLAELGVDVGKPAEHAGGMGGPFVPPRTPREATSFERQLYRISVARIQIQRLHALAAQCARSQAARGRGRSRLCLWHSAGPFHWLAGNAYRIGYCTASLAIQCGLPPTERSRRQVGTAAMAA